MQLNPEVRAEASEDSGSELTRYLKAVRVHHFAASLLTNWIVAMCSVMLLGAVLLVSRRTWFGNSAPNFAPADIALYAALAALLAGAIALGWTYMRLASLRDTAGRVDAALGLGTLASTAIEHLPRSSSEPLPVRAMFEELRDRLARSRPADVVGPRLRSWFVLLPAAFGVAALAAVLPLEHVSSRVSATVVVGASVDQVAADLELLASLLELGAEEDDVELERFVPELRQMGEQIAVAEMVDEATARRLSEVLESLATAAAASEMSSGRRLTTAFAEVAASQPPADSVERPFRFGSEEPPSAESSDGTAGTEAAVKSPDFDPASVFRTLGEVASSLERQAGNSTTQPGSEAAEQGGSSARSTGYYTDWDDEMAAEQAAKRAAIRERGRGESVAGEAVQSDDSMGDAAGRGGQPLEQGTAETDAGLLELATEEFTVVAELREGGDTNSYLPEPVQGRPLDSGMTAALRESLVAGTEVPISNESIVSGNRDVIAAYFGRSLTGPRSAGAR